MTHLLASLLTGVASGTSGASPIKAETGRNLPRGPGFEKVLQDTTAQSSVSQDPSDTPIRDDHEATTDRKQGSDDKATPGAMKAGQDQPGQRNAPPVGVTLLGGTFGARARVPALTFMLPAGAGPDDMAAAIRTQVLRFTAARNLDPGSLDNLRIAISSREMGHVEVDLSARGDKLDVEIVASGRETEAVLRKTSGDLKEGILARADRFRQVDVKVSTRDSMEDETPNRQHRQGAERDTEQNQGQQSDHRVDEAHNPDPESPDPESTEDRS